ncbi:MAG: DUF4118 domain-containing protein [Candidatus Obscuribacterales bacterium]|nr:DUF4118 domain-containing protein [Candidatus Obscuribacterales bacterium]
MRPVNSARSWQKFLPEARAIVIATLGVMVLTAMIYLLRLDLSFANVSMIYLLAVMLAALYLGRTPAIWAAVTSFFSVNWFFVSPRYTFTVANQNEWLSLCAFLVTAMVTGQLTAMLKARAAEASRRQRETEALAEASWAIASQVDPPSALAEVVKQISKVVVVEIAAVTMRDDDDAWQLSTIRLPSASSANERTTSADETLEPQAVRNLSEEEELLARIKLSTKSGYESDPSERIVPVKIEDRSIGAVYLRTSSQRLEPEQDRVVQSLLNHAAVILQHHALMKQQARNSALADADKLKTALLSMVSHDFRSPLTSIKAAVSTLLSDGAPFETETYRGLCQTIEQETDRLNSMVGNILDLSRLEADAWRPQCEHTSPQELIGMALSGFDANDNARISVHIDASLIEIYVDPVQIAQVIRNLVENALKYSTAVVHLEVRSCDHQSVVIEVADRGRGLPAGDPQQIFEPFYRAPELKESSVPGIGIGLAVCKGLVESHKGTLSAIRRPEGGTIFRANLPKVEL